MTIGIKDGHVNLTREQDILYHAIIGALYINLPTIEQEYLKLLEKVETVDG